MSERDGSSPWCEPEEIAPPSHRLSSLSLKQTKLPFLLETHRCNTNLNFTPTLLCPIKNIQSKIKVFHNPGILCCYFNFLEVANPFHPLICVTSQSPLINFHRPPARSRANQIPPIWNGLQYGKWTTFFTTILNFRIFRPIRPKHAIQHPTLSTKINSQRFRRCVSLWSKFRPKIFWLIFSQNYTILRRIFNRHLTFGTLWMRMLNFEKKTFSLAASWDFINSFRKSINSFIGSRSLLVPSKEDNKSLRVCDICFRAQIAETVLSPYCFWRSQNYSKVQGSRFVQKYDCGISSDSQKIPTAQQSRWSNNLPAFDYDNKSKQ